MATNKEFLAMSQIERILGKLDTDQRRRVFAWLQDKITSESAPKEAAPEQVSA